MTTKPIISLILASASPRRRVLMRKAGYRFRIIPSRIREVHPRCPPFRLVQSLAVQKAIAVARRHPYQLVLGADTIVYLNGQVIGKPKNPSHADRILASQSGKWQKVYTGVALAWNGGRSVMKRGAVSKVKMRVLSERDIAWARKRHLDKAGAYAVQQRNDPFVTRIVGDFDNVVGLPMRVVGAMLKLFTRQTGTQIR